MKKQPRRSGAVSHFASWFSKLRLLSLLVEPLLVEPWGAGTARRHAMRCLAARRGAGVVSYSATLVGSRLLHCPIGLPGRRGLGRCWTALLSGSGGGLVHGAPALTALT